MEQEVTSTAPKSGKNRQGFRDFVKSIESLGDEYLVEKAPFHIPADLKEFLVKAAPYIVAFILLLTLPAILAFIGLGSMLSMVSPYYGPLMVVSTAFSIAVFALNIAAIKPLSNRSATGWKYMFYAQILSFVAWVLGGWVLWAIVWGIIGFYFLFQLKSYYK